ncbi:hypothetical protein [Burkholderia ubonensis]|uniref:hypothetical protein n=2 Tax=Burkholderia ubonensis TaxID=101571 RepID=UPI0005DA091F|nr:hypothetical protein [Burkholderia ubonensis]AJX16259.1 hypothetical protein BW23_2745 [Burkholderia ubonensis MSMB22]KVD37039.1 hypothetical protein WI83_06970 [Burkholderia ubonensis]KVG22442.1 hypothetical protein WJ29_11120 [Burkholderia ubonensis]KVO56081.1 hypothetical protein WJ77_13385 [Burkholderia ubonensis]KVO64133.1 hypothetical protein WJ78_19190 [Burkholderia ubonensis]
MITIGMKNIAPSAQHRTHHVYVFAVDAASVRPFIFEESIGGGHAELGGSIALRMCDLDGWPGDWRAHLRQAGCEDAIAVIETAADERQAVDAVLALRTAGR